MLDAGFLCTIRGVSDDGEDEGGPNNVSNGTCSLGAQGTEEAAKLASLEREERRRRFFEVKMATEKAQRHLDSLKMKKKKKEEEVR